MKPVSDRETPPRAFGRGSAIVDTALPDDVAAGLGITDALDLFEHLSALRVAKGLRPLSEGDLPTNRFAFRRLVALAREELSRRRS